MKTTTFTLALLAASTVFSACADKPANLSATLERAEDIMYTNPDSAVILLSQLKEMLPTFDKSTQMYYQLLCIKADDKAYILHTSDSLILTLIDYYDYPGRRTHLAETYYYAGRVYRDLQDAPQALHYLQKAEQRVLNSGDNNLLGLIYTQMGTLFLYQDLYDEGLNVFQKAYQLDALSKDTANMIYDLRDMANAFLFLQNMDSAFFYNRQAQELAQRMGSDEYISLIASQTATLYRDIEKYDLGKAAIQIPLNNLQYGHKSAIYSIAAKLHRQMHQPDSAAYYYTKLLECGTIYARQSAHRGLAEIAIDKGTPREALLHLQEYVRYTDSIQKITDTETIHKLTSLYNYQWREQENSRLKMKNRQQWYAATITSLMLVVAIIITVMRAKNKRTQLMLRLEKVEQYKEQALRQSQQAIDANEQLIKELTYELQNLKEKHTELQQHLLMQKQKAEAENKFIAIQIKEREEREKLFYSSNLYRLFLTTSNKKPDKVTATHWKELEQEINDIYDGFIGRLHQLYPFSDFEIKVCCLIKARVPLRQIAILTTHAPSGISSVRERMHQKVFGEKGKGEKWDEFILSY